MSFFFKDFFNKDDYSDVIVPQIGDAETIEGLPSEQSQSAVPVHVLQGDVKIRLSGGRLRIEPKDGEVLERPIEQVSSLHIHGWATVTSPAITALALLGAPVIWRSPNGYPLAHTNTMSPQGLEVRRSQYLMAANKELCLKQAKAFVIAKIDNMAGLVKRRGKDQTKVYVKKLNQFAKKADRASSLKSLLGIEGAATAVYFSTWSLLLSYRASKDAFVKRTRRPPKDMSNAALSYLYTVLMGECMCALTASGLDPREGFLHSVRAGRPALALDFMEPFRPVLVDAVVTKLLNMGQFNDIETATPLLGDAGKKLVLTEYENKLSSKASLGDPKNEQDWREVIHREALRFSRSVAEGNTFQPVKAAW